MAWQTSMLYTQFIMSQTTYQNAPHGLPDGRRTIMLKTTGYHASNNRGDGRQAIMPLMICVVASLLFGDAPGHLPDGQQASMRYTQITIPAQVTIVLQTTDHFHQPTIPDGSRSTAYFSSLNWITAPVPAARAMMPPLPGTCRQAGVHAALQGSAQSYLQKQPYRNTGFPQA
jgi:hypothetical protein